MSDQIANLNSLPATGNADLAGGSQVQWLVKPVISQSTQMQSGCLVCLPHAGGSASYFRKWSKKVPGHLGLMAVQYAGREECMNAPFVTSMSTLLNQLLPFFLNFTKQPFVLFGHSMGAAVAFELCARLEQLRCPVAGLMLSSHPPLEHIHPTYYHQGDEKALWTELVRIGGTPPAILAEHELRDLLTPILFADYELIETYKPNTTKKLKTRATICFGDADADVPTAQIPSWQQYFHKPITMMQRPGGHFYLDDYVEDILTIADEMIGQSSQRSSGVVG